MKKTFKKISACLILVMMLVMMCSGFVFAGIGDTAINPDVPRFVDGVGMFSNEENTMIEFRCNQLAEKYGRDVVIWFVDNAEGLSNEEYADDAYDYNEYGYGAGRSGVILLVNLQESQRGVWISTRGECLNDYSDEDISNIVEITLTPLRKDTIGKEDYYTAIGQYLNITDTFLEDIERDGYHNWNSMEGVASGIALTVCVTLGIMISFAVGHKLNHDMLTVLDATEADGYIVEDSFELKSQSDRFLYSNITKVAKPKDSGSSHSSHTSSSGASHGGGGGSF